MKIKAIYKEFLLIKYSQSEVVVKGSQNNRQGLELSFLIQAVILWEKLTTKKEMGAEKIMTEIGIATLWLTATLPLVQMANHLDSLKIGDNTRLILLLEYFFLFLRVFKEYHHATCFCIIRTISKGPLFCFIIWKIDNIVRLSAQSKLLAIYKIKLRAYSLFTGAGMGWRTGLFSCIR